MLTNVDLTLWEVLPGAGAAAVILEATFQLLPVYVDISKHNPVLQTLSGPAVLLVRLYLMANVIVLGAEVTGGKPDERGRRIHRLSPSRGHKSASSAVRREGSMRVLCLPPVSELGDRSGLAARDEHRIEAEAAAGPRDGLRLRPRGGPCRGTRAPSGESRISSAT